MRRVSEGRGQLGNGEAVVAGCQTDRRHPSMCAALRSELSAATSAARHAASCSRCAGMRKRESACGERDWRSPEGLLARSDVLCVVL
jgi:hypothetical protein